MPVYLSVVDIPSDIKTLTTRIPEVSPGTTVELHFLLFSACVLSGDSCCSVWEPFSLLDRKHKASISPWPDSWCSWIKHPKASSVSKIHIVKSDSKLLATNVFSPGDHSSAIHSVSDYKANAILEWLLVGVWPPDVNSGKWPTLVDAVSSTLPEANNAIFSGSWLTYALVAFVPYVGWFAAIELDLLVLVVLPWSCDNHCSIFIAQALSYWHSKITIFVCSNGWCPTVKSPECFYVFKLEALRSDSELTSSNALAVVQGFVSCFSASEDNTHSIANRLSVLCKLWLLYVFVLLFSLYGLKINRRVCLGRSLSLGLHRLFTCLWRRYKGCNAQQSKHDCC